MYKWLGRDFEILGWHGLFFLVPCGSMQVQMLFLPMPPCSYLVPRRPVMLAGWPERCLVLLLDSFAARLENP